MQRTPRGLAFLIMLGLLGLLFLMAPWVPAEEVSTKPFSEFTRDLTAGRLKAATISDRTLAVEEMSGEKYTVTLPPDVSAVQSMLAEQGVELTVQPASQGSIWLGLLALLVPLGIVGYVIWLQMGQKSGGGAGQVFSFGQSKARLYAPGEKQVGMSDVAGLTEVKEELWEVVDFLRHPKRYQELGARIPKGILLWGPPGTGKTLLARAVAGEAGVPFYSISGSDFVEIFAGVGAARVRDLFEKARKSAPCILFVDEIDAVGRQRGASMGGGSDEREQTLNQLLVEMDGFSETEGIIVMAATNRLDVLDQAILRPGRFDRQIMVDPPDRAGRKEILEVHARGKRLTEGVELERIAAMTVGFTGADLANLLNEAALLAARRRLAAISLEELRSAFERVIAGGPSLKRAMVLEEKRRVAVHEAGHAVVSRHLTHADPIEKVTIVPRGRALGYVMYRPGEEKNLHSATEIMDRIVALLGGRAAEEVVMGEVSSGAADDLERATALARRMVMELGMSQEIGLVALGASGAMTAATYPGNPRTMSDATAATVDHAVRRLVFEAYDRAVDLLKRHRDALERIAGALLERETLDGTELETMIAP